MRYASHCSWKHRAYCISYKEEKRSSYEKKTMVETALRTSHSCKLTRESQVMKYYNVEEFGSKKAYHN